MGWVRSLNTVFNYYFMAKKQKNKTQDVTSELIKTVNERSIVLSDRIFQIKDIKLLVSCQYVIASISFSSEHDGALIKGEYNKRRQ